MSLDKADDEKNHKAKKASDPLESVRSEARFKG